LEVEIPAPSSVIMIEKPSGRDLPLAANGTFAPQAEQLLAIEDGIRRRVGIRGVHEVFDSSRGDPTRYP
jgi:hypothetical protein